MLSEYFKFGRGYVEKKSNPFEMAAFPIVRRIFSHLLASDLVSVQPMSAPTGLINHPNYINAPYIPLLYIIKQNKINFKFGHKFIPAQKIKPEREFIYYEETTVRA